jgi:hypothetical protein
LPGPCDGTIAATAPPPTTAKGDAAINAAPSSPSDRGRVRRRYETIGLVVMTIAIIASALYALSWSRPGVTSQGTGDLEAPTLAPTQPSESPEPPEPSDELALDDTFVGTRASTTVTGVRVVDETEGLEPPAGEVWVGVGVERCASETQSSAPAPWTRWVLVDAEGNRFRGTDDVPDGVVRRPLTTRDFAAGQCRSGSVVVAVPESSAQTIASVRFEPPAGPAAAWTVAG